MTKIQSLLIGGMLLLAILASRAVGTQIVNRLAMLALLLCGLFFVAMPDRTTAIAHFLGVGRGTDLLLYLGLLTGGYAMILQYVRSRRLEH